MLVFVVYLTGSRELRLSASTDADMKGWIADLKRACLDESDTAVNATMSPSSSTRPITIPTRQHAAPAPASSTAASSSMAMPHTLEGSTFDDSGLIYSSMDTMSPGNFPVVIGPVKRHNDGEDSGASARSGLGSSSPSTISSTGSFDGVMPAAPLDDDTTTAAAIPSGLRGDDAAAAVTGTDSSSLKNLDSNQRQVADVLERRWVYMEGYLLRLRPKLKIWSRQWCVLRQTGLYIYSSEKEYSLQQSISVEAIEDVVEIEPLSKARQWCFMIVSQERNMRFCCDDEDTLEHWLGAFSSVMEKWASTTAKKKQEEEKQHKS